MRVLLKKNSDSSSSSVPYFAHIEIATITADLETSFQIPIRVRQSQGTELYTSEICGFQVEGDTPAVVISLIEKLVPGLVNMARLPTYVFIARRSHKMYPVYTYEDKVFATTPGGPLFEHVELAKVREFLADYLHNIKALGVPGRSESLHVRGVRRTNLALIRPVFYLKKRPEAKDDNEFWAPVFLTDDESGVYTYAANGRREVDLAGGYEALLLRSQVAQALIADKRLKDNYALRPDRLLPDYWERVKATLVQLPHKLGHNGTTFDLYKNGKYVVAVEHRIQEDRYSLYVGKDIDSLRDRTARDLVRRGLTKEVSDVKIVE